MTSTIHPADRLGPAPGPWPDRGLKSVRRLGALDLLLLSAWCGLAAGWLEVGTRVLCKHITVIHRMYQMSRHFLWLVPLSNLLLFSGAGVLLALSARWFPRAGGWFGPRLIVALALVPALLVAGPRIYATAWVILAAGTAMRLVPWLERTANAWRRWLTWSFPGLLGLVLVAAGFVFGGDWLKQRREAGGPLPPAGSPNILLIVLDTVRAGHLSLYGYQRPTTPSLDRLANRSVRFDEARATAPWTLASHASMFSGLLPHELAVNWNTPLGTNFPTLAEYLGSRGYATAGFVGNTQYCSYDTGLDRGFTHYEDYAPDLAHLRPLRLALLVDRAWEGASALGLWASREMAIPPQRPGVWDWVFKLGLWASQGRFDPALHWLLAPLRKDAESINREFLGWLSDRPEPRRSFFAFLNYYDAHTPYLPPEGTPFRFGSGPRALTDFLVLVEHWKAIDKDRVGLPYRVLIRDSYDNCLAYLDERLGELFDILQRRGELDRTAVIVTADHGEELGDHGLFEHGESLYRPEVRVPLLIALPSRGHSAAVVREIVSLRDLPATIVDLAGLAARSPFPGRSFAGLWRGPAPKSPADAGDLEGAVSELAEPNPTHPSQGRSPASWGPLISLAEGDYVYIRNERDGRELLFHEPGDPNELANLAKVEAMGPVLERMRRRLDRIKARPSRAPR